MEHVTPQKIIINKIFKEYSTYGEEMNERFLTLFKLLLRDLAAVPYKDKKEYCESYNSIMDDILSSETDEERKINVDSLKEVYEKSKTIKINFYSTSVSRDRTRKNFSVRLTDSPENFEKLSQLDNDILTHLTDCIFILKDSCRNDKTVSESIQDDLDWMQLNLVSMIRDRKKCSDSIVCIRSKIPSVSNFKTREDMVNLEYSLLINFKQF